MRGACPVSPEKVRYSARSLANVALTNVRERYGSERAITVYKCSCRGWHLTHIRESAWAQHRRRGSEA
jgi:hypothetical protein